MSGGQGSDGFSVVPRRLVVVVSVRAVVVVGREVLVGLVVPSVLRSVGDLSVVLLSVGPLSVVPLSVVPLSVVTLSVVTLSVLGSVVRSVVLSVDTLVGRTLMSMLIWVPLLDSSPSTRPSSDFAGTLTSTTSLGWPAMSRSPTLSPRTRTSTFSLGWATILQHLLDLTPECTSISLASLDSCFRYSFSFPFSFDSSLDDLLSLDSLDPSEICRL